ncbi:hypothetical protein GGTG_12188 [Gaeumannomyces tritici R3-111a-1]|uniref:Uncharacterized protein n=1 Tax=Gaeumannomyces tritici (strain R3-111a-1) TaxID=644352 RepID=J3PFB0_GAET3|nr:hypothetical protein GGTG_12188 [Gaeumannomyces tritici R3-111a-1]EJT70012.1 hypothetical protein GGTG_12188 [Gaeumannomyces tritici R3-111a-1]
MEDGIVESLLSRMSCPRWRTTADRANNTRLLAALALRGDARCESNRGHAGHGRPGHHHPPAKLLADWGLSRGESRRDTQHLVAGHPGPIENPRVPASWQPP